MKYVEHLHMGYQWANPLSGEAELEVQCAGDDLQIQGLLPTYQGTGHPWDIFYQYQTARKNYAIGKQRTGKDSPHIRFANADTDQKLIAFARSFGPVVAKSVKLKMGPPIILDARQDLNELRSERLIYGAALALVVELRKPKVEPASLGALIGEIAAKIIRWPQQWRREYSQRKAPPFWKLRDEGTARIQRLIVCPVDAPLPPEVDGRIVICELVNTFAPQLFPNPLEMHSSIRYGIRPLLYAILRQEFLYEHETGVCVNDRCRDFFEIERAGQQFCSPECSRQQRQRDYWSTRGRKLRSKRSRRRRK